MASAGVTAAVRVTDWPGFTPVGEAVRFKDVAVLPTPTCRWPLKLPSDAYTTPRVSPDGTQLAMDLDDGRGVNIWTYEFSGGSSPRQLTYGGHNRFPTWSPNGQRIAFQSDREGDLAIFWQRADGADTAQRLTKPEPGTSHVPESSSRTGDRFSFSVSSAGSGSSLWTLSIPDKQASAFGQVRSTFLINSSFSPDGQWLAYSQFEQSGGAVVVEPFPSTGVKYLIANNAIAPMWSANGKTLFYQPPTQFFKVDIVTRPSFKFSPPVKLPRPFIASGPAAPRSYDVMPDGRFLGVVQSGQPQGGPTQIQIVLNWFEELKQRAPSGR